MKAVPLEIRWNDDLPIFSSEPFLKAVGDEYGWIGGVDESGKQLCILPYTVMHEMGIRLVRFRVETIPLVEDFGVQEEHEFLSHAVQHLRCIGADVIIPGTTNAIFRTYPAGADAAPYGSYIIDLGQAEDVLWRSMDRNAHRNINTAQKSGVVIRSGIEFLDVSYELICDTFRRSHLPFMSHEALVRYMHGLGENGRVLVAEYQGEVQSCVVYAFSKYCAYAVYGGNTIDQVRGANKLLHWNAIRSFRNSGVQRYDFVGARINPEKGSKAEAINSFKEHLGGRLIQGYMWKYSLRPMQSLAYTLGIRLLRGGDIVDHERPKLKSVSRTDQVMQ